MQADKLHAALAEALEECEFEAAATLVEQIEPADFTEEQSVAILELIRSKQRFVDLETAAVKFVTAGKQSTAIKTEWMQSLLNQGRHVPAISIGKTLEQSLPDDDTTISEIDGLLGRGYKQLYVDQGDTDNLDKAIAAYEKGWNAKQGDYRWHGINLAALLHKADDDSATIDIGLSSEDLARDILAEIDTLPEPEPWDAGSAMEASIALGDDPGALRWATEYVNSPKVNAFQLSSTLRQLHEIWQIDNKQIGKALIPVLEYQLLQKPGGSVDLGQGKIEDQSGFEAVYGNEGYTNVMWLESLMGMMDSVAKVRNRKTGEPFGTGFVINGDKLNEDWGDELVFITNSHVVSDDAEDESPLGPDDALAEFTRIPGKPTAVLGDKLFHSKRTDLDTWICRLEAPDEAIAMDLSFYPPRVPEEGDKPQRVFVMGHPKGGDLVVSMFNNDLVGYVKPYVHYKSPTEGGSSGSPVLSRDLNTFALHHRAKDDLEVNEGILFQAIRDKTKSS